MCPRCGVGGCIRPRLDRGQRYSGRARPTVTLTIRYLQPTVINRPARFEGWVTSIEGRRIHSRGQLIQGGVVTVEAVGEFATMDRSRIASMHRRGGGGGGG